MKKSDFKLIKCRGCKRPFKAKPECKPKTRPNECYYCNDCLSYKKATIIQLDNISKRIEEMDREIERLRRFHEDRMKMLYEEDGV